MDLLTTPSPFSRTLSRFQLQRFWKILTLAALLAVASAGALFYPAPLQAQSQSTSGVTPSVTIYLSPEAFSGAGEEVEATFTFNTVVTGFDLSDISVSGGSKPTSALTPSQGGAVYTGTFTTVGDAGDMTVTVAANSASNSDGATGPTAEVSATAQRDTHALKVKSFTSVVGSFIWKDSSFQNSIVFSEAVTDFGPEDLVITNGAMEGFFEEERDLKFNFYVRVNGQGDMLATLKANSVKDADGMWGPPSPVTLRVPMGVTDPKVVITDVPAFIRDTTPFTASIAFNQRVTGFTVQDIRAANATLDHFAEEAAGKKWAVEVTPDGTGDVTLTIGKSSVMRASSSQEGPMYAVTARAIWDNASPEVERITFVPVGIVNKWDRIKIIVAFDEPVRGFGMEDIAVTGAIKHPALQEEADGALYTGLLNHTGGGDGVTVAVAASSVTDRAGNAGPVDSFSSTAASMDVTVTDYDADDDYLIEISTLAQLHVLRYDRDGDGDVLGNDHKAYDQAFPNGAPNMGCPGPCRGYELAADLDFDTNGSRAADGGDAYWNGGKGWKPIGKDRQWKSRYLWDIDREHAYNAIFEGNDHTISNLYMKEEQYRQAGLGLFRTLGADAEVRNLRLEKVNITGGQYIGALSGSSEGYVHHVSSSGRIEAHHVRAGGLIGSLRPGGLVAHSHSSAAIHGGRHFSGGLVGNVFKASVQYSYATGDVSGVYAVGGLVGALETAVPADTCEQSPPAASPVYSGAGEPGSIVGSYATGRVSAVAEAGGLVGVNFYSNITNSYATGDVAGRDFDPFYGEHVDDHGTGGLVGGNAGSITNSYATGRLTPKPGGPSGAGGPHRFRDGVYGGLVGKNYSSGSGHFRTVTFVDGSPAQRIDTFGGAAAGSYWDAQTSGFTASAAGVGMTTAELQGPTSAAGIYAGWDTSVWDFGTSGGYPTLRVSRKTAALLPEAEPNTDCPAPPTTLTVPGPGPKKPAICPVPRGCWFRSVPENSPEGTLVGAPVTGRGTGTASYRMSGTDAGKFTIDPATGQIKVGPNPDLDYEDDAKNVFHVKVAITRPGSSYSSVAVISVTDVNEAPAFGQETVTLTIAENRPVGTIVGALPIATDPDGDALTYTLGNTDDDGHFAINAATGQLLTKGPLDSRSEDSYSVTVTATDPDGLSASVPVTITVTVAPGLLRRSVPENSPEGALVGDPVTASLPAGATATYSLSGADAGKFAIDSATGQIAVGANPDLDYEDDAKNAFAVKVTADVSDGTSLRYGVAISVSDVNEAPAFAGDSVDLSVAENTDARKAIGAPVSATDPDGDALTYSLGNTDDDGHFAINAATGQLLTKGPLDSRSEDSYSVTVTATDPDGLSASVPVTITVTVAPGLLRRSVPENSPEGTIVGAPATALVSGGGTVTYRLSGADAGKFTIDSATGQIAVGANPDLDYEDDAKNSFIVRVRATSNNGMAFSYGLRIMVTDVNEGPAFGQEMVTLTIAENQPLETIVGALPAATDPDGDALRYELRGKADSYDYLTFNVDVSTGSPRLKTEAPIDYESSGNDRAYNFELIVKDPALLEDSIKVIVNVTDVNEAPEFSAASVALKVAENTASGTDIGAPVAARDVDGDTLTYTLGTTGDDGHFAIDSATGQLLTKGALDYESDASYSVTVTATDPDGLSDSVPVTITVTDAADAPAAFAAGMASRSVPENSPAGTKVGLPVTTTDQDGDTLTYSISGSDAGSFAIDSATGQITVKTGAALDHETKATYIVRVTASDGSLTSHVDVTISVTDVFVDHDQDDDGLIEIDSLQQLNAMRWDLNGDGRPDKRDAVDDYERVFPEGSPDMGCPSACLGYELTADLTFDTNDNGKVGSGDDYWNGGKGWLPIGGSIEDPFTAVFDGGGHTISELLIERARKNTGLFGVISRGGVIRNVGLEDVALGVVLTKPDVAVAGVHPPISVSVGWANKGALVGYIYRDGRVERSYSTGFVKGIMTVGGLVGLMIGGTIEDSYTKATVGGNNHVGGVVGRTIEGDKNAVVRHVYSTALVAPNDMIIGGELSTAGTAGAIVGHSNPALEGSIGYYLDNAVSPRGAGSGKSASELQAPTSATGIYAEWDENVWDFGTSSQYPALKYDTDGDGTATAAEFGSQNSATPFGGRRSAAPSRSSRATIEPVSDLQVTLQDDGSALLTWHESSGIDGDVSYRVRRRSETAGFEIVARMVVDSDGDGVLEYRDADGALGHEYSVRPFNSEGRQLSKWSGPAAAVPPNRDPAFAEASIALSVAENTAAGTDIGDPVIATDPDGDALTYALGGADAGHFAIDVASGQLQTKGALDYETTASYTVTVTATDPDGLSASIAVTITVTDVADTPPGKPGAPTFSDVQETRFRVVWTAPAAGSSAITGYGIQYKLSSEPDDAYTDVSPTPRGGGKRGFNVIARTGQFIVPGTSYDVRVREQNAEGWGEWSDAGSVTTAGTAPAADAPPGKSAAPTFSDIQETRFRILWKAPTPGSAPITGYGLQYKLSSASDAAWADVKPEPRGVRASGFNLTNRSGQNITPATSYDVRVRAKNDAGWGGWSDAGTVTTTGTAPPPKNRPPAFAADSALALSVAENTAAGTDIGAPITATDPDGDALTYALGGADADHFAIDGGTGQLSTQGALDYESKDFYAVSVTATDPDGLSASVSVSIEVTDGNEAPAFADSALALSVAENTAAGTVIGAPITATDPDGDALTYALGDADADHFAIDGGTGQLSTQGALDYESDDSYTVTVTATDDGGLSDSVAVSITVTDVADTPPGQPAPPTFTNIQETRFRILWAAPTPGSSPVDAVGLQYKPTSQGPEAWADVKPTPGTGRRGFNLTNRGGQHVTAGISYDVRVREGNAQGWGPWSDAGTVTTAGTASAQPARTAAPTFTEVQETRFRILWQAPTPGASPITGYGLQYKLTSASDEAWADVKPEPRGVRASGFNLTNRRGQSIAPGTSYDVRVRAQNAEGWGEWSEAGTVTTAGTAPAGS